MNDPNIFKQTRCFVCKKRVSTRLCDFVVGYSKPIIFSNYKDTSEQDSLLTCDLPLCDICTKEHNGVYDFCPYHAPMLEKIIPTEEMKRAIISNMSKQMFGE